MSVPSNLIPSTITQLPEAPVADPAGYFPIVISGTTYKVQFSQIFGNVEVPAARSVFAGTGLTGGGSLSSDITIAVANGGITDTQLNTTGVTAGTYGSGSSIPVITVTNKGRVTSVTEASLVVTGFVPDDRTINAGVGLSGGGNLAADRTLSVNFSSATPQPVGSATGGTSVLASRDDHIHPAINLTNTGQTSGVLPMSRGGTGDAISPVAGAVVYVNGSSMGQTDPGTTGYLLKANNTAAPSWVDPATLVVARADNISGGAANRLVYQSDTDTTDFVNAPTIANTYLRWDGSTLAWSTIAGQGTVTSVDGSGGGTGLTLTGGPITLAGTLTLGGTLDISAGGTGLGTTPTNGKLLIGNGSGYTLNGLTAGSGISVTNGAGAITIANTAQDQTVVLTAGTNVSVSGTYPSFTISAAGDVVGPAGATSNAVALYDGGTGKLLKNSAVTISATGVISGVAEPVGNTDAATKYYVDNLVSTGLTFHDPVQLATTSAFTGYNITYNNGSSGVSATITQAVPYASLTIDSTAAAVNNRILVKDAANAAYNGVYYVSSTGSALTPWVLTRTSDADTYGPAVGQLSKNDYFFTQNGVANKGAAFVCTTSGTITFGTTGITFTEFSVSQVYTVGNGLSLTGTTISLETPVNVLNGGTGLSSAASNGQLLIGNGAGFTLSGLTAGTGISVTNATGSISIANTSPDQTVTLTGSTAISVTGTYPSFTLTNTAPDQTVILTGTGGTSISGTYPSFTVNSTAGTVTSVDGSSTLSGVTLSGGPITSSGRLTIAGTLGISSGGTGLGSTPTNGQVLIGNGTGFTLSQLTAGTNVTITSGTGSITIAASGGGGGGSNAYAWFIAA